MTVVTSSLYKYISLVLLIITFSLVIYVVITEFLRLKTLHNDLKLACRIPSEEASKIRACKYLYYTSLGEIGSTIPLTNILVYCQHISVCANANECFQGRKFWFTLTQNPHSVSKENSHTQMY